MVEMRAARGSLACLNCQQTVACLWCTGRRVNFRKRHSQRAAQGECGETKRRPVTGGGKSGTWKRAGMVRHRVQGVRQESRQMYHDDVVCGGGHQRKGEGATGRGSRSGNIKRARSGWRSD